MIPLEEWRPIQNYQGIYWVSDKGRIQFEQIGGEING
ncbi:NUMOD4 domain-containing protein [Lentilactobacillus buchneri]